MIPQIPGKLSGIPAKEIITTGSEIKNLESLFKGDTAEFKIIEDNDNKSIFKKQPSRKLKEENSAEKSFNDLLLLCNKEVNFSAAVSNPKIESNGSSTTKLFLENRGEQKPESITEDKFPEHKIARHERFYSELAALKAFNEIPYSPDSSNEIQNNQKAMREGIYEVPQITDSGAPLDHLKSGESEKTSNVETSVENQNTATDNTPEVLKNENFAEDLLADKAANKISISRESHEVNIQNPGTGMETIKEYSGRNAKNGMDVADDDSGMRNGAQTEKLSVLDRQNMPGKFDFEQSDRENFAGSGDRDSAPVHNGKNSYTNEVFSVRDANILNIITEKNESDIHVNFHGGGIGAKVVDELKPHIFSIKQNKADDITVRIKVDDNTELSIRMYAHDGKIFASAFLEKGDFLPLKHHWMELQENLSKYGVDLGMLSMSNGEKRQNRYKNNEEQFEIVPINVQHDFLKVKEQEKVRQVALDVVEDKSGWESWA